MLCVVTTPINLVFLVETKCCNKLEGRVKSRINFDCCFCVASIENSGGLIVCCGNSSKGKGHFSRLLYISNDQDWLGIILKRQKWKLDIDNDVEIAKVANMCFNHLG